jgi:hypothetical protein
MWLVLLHKYLCDNNEKQYWRVHGDLESTCFPFREQFCIYANFHGASDDEPREYSFRRWIFNMYWEGEYQALKASISFRQTRIAASDMVMPLCASLDGEKARSSVSFLCL